MATTKKSQIGVEEDVFSRIPTVRDRIYTIETVDTIELPSKIRLFDSKAIKVSKVEETSRENYVLVNNTSSDHGLQVCIERKAEYEVGEPIRTEKDAEKLLIKVLKKELDNIQDAKRKIEKYEVMLEKAVNHIEENGLEYDDKGSTIGIVIEHRS